MTLQSTCTKALTFENATLGIIAQRDASVRSKFLSLVFEEAERGVRFTAVEVIHGSLLVVGELLQLPHVLELSMPQSFNLSNITSIVMQYCYHREALVRQTVITLLPIVARIDHRAFRAEFAADAVAYLINTLTKGSSDAAVTFLSLSSLLHIAGPQIVEPHREHLIALVLDGITPTARKPLVSNSEKS